MEKKLYRMKEAAEMLSISRSRIYQLVEEGKLRKTKDNPARISSDSIREYYISQIEEEG